MNIKTIMLSIIIVISMVMVSTAAPVTDEHNYYNYDIINVDGNNYSYSESYGNTTIISMYNTDGIVKKQNTVSHTYKNLGDVIIINGISNTTFRGNEVDFTQKHRSTNGIITSDTSNIRKVFSGYQIDNGSHHVYHEEGTTTEYHYWIKRNVSGSDEVVITPYVIHNEWYD